MKNALKRGQTLVKAKQSFINAGYTAAEVEEAAGLVGSITSKTPATPLPQAQPTQQPKKSLSKKNIIILAVAGVIIIITALLLGLFL